MINRIAYLLIGSSIINIYHLIIFIRTDFLRVSRILFYSITPLAGIAFLILILSLNSILNGKLDLMSNDFVKRIAGFFLFLNSLFSGVLLIVYGYGIINEFLITFWVITATLLIISFGQK